MKKAARKDQLQQCGTQWIIIESREKNQIRTKHQAYQQRSVVLPDVSEFHEKNTIETIPASGGKSMVTTETIKTVMTKDGIFFTAAITLMISIAAQATSRGAIAKTPKRMTPRICHLDCICAFVQDCSIVLPGAVFCAIRKPNSSELWWILSGNSIFTMIISYFREIML